MLFIKDLKVFFNLEMKNTHKIPVSAVLNWKLKIRVFFPVPVTLSRLFYTLSHLYPKWYTLWIPTRVGNKVQRTKVAKVLKKIWTKDNINYLYVKIFEKFNPLNNNTIILSYIGNNFIKPTEIYCFIFSILHKVVLFILL